MEGGHARNLTIFLDDETALYVPENLHTSCDLLILVNQPAEPAVSSDVVGLGCCVVGKGS